MLKFQHRLCLSCNATGVVDYLCGCKPPTQVLGTELSVASLRAVNTGFVTKSKKQKEWLMASINEDTGLLRKSIREDMLGNIKSGDVVYMLQAPNSVLRGKAVLRSDYGWVLNVGGRHGTPKVVNVNNILFCPRHFA